MVCSNINKIGFRDVFKFGLDIVDKIPWALRDQDVDV